MSARLKSILIRAFKTMCQTAASMIIVGVGLEDINWIRIISVSLVAFIASVLTNLGGTPETKAEGALEFSSTDAGDLMMRVTSDLNAKELYSSGREYITMKIIDNVKE